jgi:hypothetical protein
MERGVRGTGNTHKMGDAKRIYLKTGKDKTTSEIQAQMAEHYYDRS